MIRAKGFHKWVAVLVSVLAMNEGVEASSELKFQPLVCDEPSRTFAARSWRKDEQLVGNTPFTLTAGWQETSANPLAAQLAVEVVLVLDLEKPWKGAYDQVREGVREMNEDCEVDGRFARWNVTFQPFLLRMEAKVDVDYFICVRGLRAPGKVDGQTFDIAVAAIPVLENDMAVVRVRTSRSETPFPNSVRLLSQVLGGIAGGLVAGPIGGIVAGATAETQAQASFDSAIERFAQLLKSIEGDQSTNDMGVLGMLNLIMDYHPEFLQPFFTYWPAAPSDREGSLQLRVPLRLMVPNRQMCGVKQELVSFFAGLEKEGAPTGAVVNQIHIFKPSQTSGGTSQ